MADCLTDGQPTKMDQEFYAQEIFKDLYGMEEYPYAIVTHSWGGNILTRVLELLDQHGRPFLGKKVVIEPPINGTAWWKFVFLTPRRFPIWYASVRSMLNGRAGKFFGKRRIETLPVRYLDNESTLYMVGCASHALFGIQGWLARTVFEPSWRLKKVALVRFLDLDHCELLLSHAVAAVIAGFLGVSENEINEITGVSDS